MDLAQGGDSCKSGNEPSGSIKCREFLDWLRTGQVLKKDSVQWTLGLHLFTHFVTAYPHFIKQRDIRLLYRFHCVRSFYITGAVFPLTFFPMISMSALDVLSPPCMCVVFVIRAAVCVLVFTYWIWNCLLVVTRLPVVRVTYLTQYSRYNTVAITKTVHTAQECPPLTALWFMLHTAQNTMKFKFIA